MTTIGDQFYLLDPANPPARGTSISFFRAKVVDEDNSGTIVNNSGDTFNGMQILDVWVNDTVTIRPAGGGGPVTYTGVTYYLSNGDAVFTPTDGQILQNGTFRKSSDVAQSTQHDLNDLGPTCFTPGMEIDTPEGPRAIETITVGDRVLTLDDGAQEVRHIVDGVFRAEGDFAPIRFDAGAFGNDKPLVVSPQHRMLISGWQAQFFYGQDEVLVAAKHLVNGVTVHQDVGGRVRYIHLLFDRHQIIWGQGVPSESYFPAHALETAEGDVRDELVRMFPELGAVEGRAPRAARPVLKRREARVLAA